MEDTKQKKKKKSNLGQISHDECEQKASDYLDGWKRAQADFINYKKDESERIASISKFASESTLLDVIDILDNLDTALSHAPPEVEHAKNWLQGITYVAKQFEDLLRKNGIEEISINIGFDPALHEAVEGDAEEGDMKVIRKGYTMHGKVLRPTRVVLNKKK